MASDNGDHWDAGSTGTDRPNEDEYPEWYRRAFGKTLVDERNSQYYSNSVRDLVRSFNTSFFWKRLCELLRTADEQSIFDTGQSLLARPGSAPEVMAKPWNSVILKTYRLNVIDNEAWPDEPAEPGGWLTAETWFTRVKDLVRTTIVVRYIDGVEAVKALIQHAAELSHLAVAISWEAKNEGYYALHATISISLTHFAEGRQLDSIVPVEIQVCTQIQDVIRSLTHTFYEGRRRLPKREGAVWQWDYKCPEFTPNYLGHLLHYADGMIVNVRDRERGGQ